MNKIKINKVQKQIAKKKSDKMVFLLFTNVIFITCFLVISSVYGPLVFYELRYALSTIYNDDVKNSTRIASDLPSRTRSGEDILLNPVLEIPNPANTDFSIIIPKINVNKNVVPNVNLTNENEVKEALGHGVGWAKGTVSPGELGNSLIFAHSTTNALDILRYNSEFTLLDKMEINDMFAVVYEDRQYDFVVYEKTVVPANDTSYLTSAADGRIVTLQTCHPAGSNANRLLVRGRLVAMETK